MSTKRVAILLSTYNGARFLGEFLESLEAQTVREFDLVVRDDGSSDGTRAILAAFSSRLSIRELPCDGNRGAALSFMRLLETSGEGYDHYMFADQDDVWYSDKVERAVARLRLCGHMTPSLYFSKLEIVDEALHHIRCSRSLRVFDFSNVLVENVATGCTIAINAAARKLILESMPARMLMHDWWCHLVVSALGTVLFDPTPTLKYRQHDANVVGSARGFFDETTRRVRRFVKGRKSGVFGVSDQAAELLRCHSSRLSAAQISAIDELLAGKATFGGRLSLALGGRFVRQRTIDTLILRVLFLINRY
jgi:glycosyltransferase involved in cell wall biosynthesis